MHTQILSSYHTERNWRTIGIVILDIDLNQSEFREGRGVHVIIATKWTQQGLSLVSIALWQASRFSDSWWARKKLQVFGTIFPFQFAFFFCPCPQTLRASPTVGTLNNVSLSGFHSAISARAGCIPSSRAKTCTQIQKGLSVSAGYLVPMLCNFLLLQYNA